jgi:hypothetical protein
MQLPGPAHAQRKIATSHITRSCLGFGSEQETEKATDKLRQLETGNWKLGFGFVSTGIGVGNWQQKTKDKQPPWVTSS